MGKNYFSLDLSFIQVTRGYWDPARSRGWAVPLLGARPLVWYWVDAQLSWIYCYLTHWLRETVGFEQGCLKFLPPSPVFGSSPEFRVQLCFWFLEKPSGFWSPVAEPIPLDGTCDITTVILHGECRLIPSLSEAPWESHFSLGLRSLCLKCTQSLTSYSSGYLTPSPHETC